jgi:hypothetical protein
MSRIIIAEFLQLVAPKASAVPGARRPMARWVLVPMERNPMLTMPTTLMAMLPSCRLRPTPIR